MFPRKGLIGLVGIAIVAAAILSRSTWLKWFDRRGTGSPPPIEAHDEHSHGAVERVKLSAQAQENLRLDVQAIAPRPYIRRLQIPGMVRDRPGQSDRGISAPVTGIVTDVRARPGDTVRPGETLFVIRLVSEAMQNAQAELFKAMRDLELNREQIERLRPGVKSGAIKEQQLIDLQNQERRLRAVVQSYRQELLNRGLRPAQIDSAATGTFVTEVTIVTPDVPPDARKLVEPASNPKGDVESAPLAFEVQELRVQLGEQVQAGQTLALLANHQLLFIEGWAFKQEAGFLTRAAEEGWEVNVEFPEDPVGIWPPLKNLFQIRYLANSVDPVSRTFAFYIALPNQSRAYDKDGETFLVWRFRPGQRVRLKVPIEKFPNEQFKQVFVLPAAALVRDAGESFVFRQNGDYFVRRPVRVLHEDRTDVVIADDGSIGTGQFIARNGAAALNRALKSQEAGGGGGHSHHDHEH